MKSFRPDFMIGYEKLLSEIKLQLSITGRHDHIYKPLSLEVCLRHIKVIIIKRQQLIAITLTCQTTPNLRNARRRHRNLSTQNVKKKLFYCCLRRAEV